MAPTVAEDQPSRAGSNVKNTPSGSSTATNQKREIQGDDSGLTEAPLDPDGSSTPPADGHPVMSSKNSSTKGKEVPSGANDVSGYVSLHSCSCC